MASNRVKSLTALPQQGVCTISTKQYQMLYVPTCKKVELQQLKFPQVERLSMRAIPNKVRSLLPRHIRIQTAARCNVARTIRL